MRISGPLEEERRAGSQTAELKARVASWRLAAGLAGSRADHEYGLGRG
jgi:hypothetical protein